MAKSPLKAIRAYCLECLDDGPQAVLNCVNTDCRLYLYRHDAPRTERAVEDSPGGRTMRKPGVD